MHLPWPRAWIPLTEETCGANLSLSELHSRGQHSATILCFDHPTSTMAASLTPPRLHPSHIPSFTIAHMQNVSLCPVAPLI